MVVLLSRIDYPVQYFGKICKFLVCLFWLGGIPPLSHLQAQSDFPLPPQLTKNVEFWITVYSQYSSNHVIIHDKNDVSIIYRVLDLNDYYDESIDLKKSGKRWRRSRMSIERYCSSFHGCRNPFTSIP